MPDPQARAVAGRILLVEPDSAEARALELVLLAHGFAVEAADDGEKALAMLLDDGFDLVLVDAMAPGLSGYDLCRQVRAHPALKDLPVILLTVLSTLTDLIDGLRCGADNFVIKPAAPSQLVARVITVLSAKTKGAGTASQSAAGLARTPADVERERILNYLASTVEDFLRVKEAQYASTLAEAEQRLQLAKLREEFVAALAHDLTVPLLGSARLLDMLMEGQTGTLAPEQRKLVLMLKETNRDLIDTVHNLVDTYRYEQNEYELYYEDLNLPKLVQGLVDEYGALAARKDQVIEFAPIGKIRPIVGDHVALRRVAANLLSNAIRFTPAGGTIAVTLSEGNQDVSLKITHTGPGIPLEDQEKLFQRLLTDDMEKRYGVATGLSLYLCRQIVEAHGGRLSCDSDRAGQGNTFTVLLPVRAPEQST